MLTELSTEFVDKVSKNYSDLNEWRALFLVVTCDFGSLLEKI